MKLFLVFLAFFTITPLACWGKPTVDSRDLLYRLALNARQENQGDDWADSVKGLVPDSYIKLVEEKYANGTWGSTTTTIMPDVIEVIKIERIVLSSTNKTTETALEEVVELEYEHVSDYVISLLILIFAITVIGCLGFWIFKGWSHLRSGSYTFRLLDDN